MNGGHKQAVPSGRDFDVYRRVRILEVSTRLVAAECGISQTRVVQIAGRVERYLRSTGIGADDKETLDAKLGMVQYQAAQRIRYVMSQMMRALELSIAGKKMFKRTESGEHRTTKTVLYSASGADECRYAMTIARLSQMQGKMPVDAYMNTVSEVAEESVDENAPCEVESKGNGKEVIVVKNRAGQERAVQEIVKRETGVDVIGMCEELEKSDVGRVSLPVENCESTSTAARDGQGSPSYEEEQEGNASDPPQEECSPSLVEQALEAVLKTDPRDASDFLAELSSQDDLLAALQNGRRARPVQKPIFEGVPFDGSQPPDATTVTAALAQREQELAEEREMTKAERQALKRKKDQLKMLLRKWKK